MSVQGPYWARAVEVARHDPRAIAARDIPASPGVYIWFRDGEPIYVGEAKGAKGLKSRLRAHLAKGIDLSRSTLRASVAVAELGVTRAFARQRPSVMTADQITHVNDWLSGCELGWHERATPASAHELEVSLRNEWTPPLNIL